MMPDDLTSDDPWSALRHRMVEEQIMADGRGIRDKRILDAMRHVPRHEFVPEDYRRAAYADHPLSIGYGQTISQPFIVAYMLESLALRPEDRVLEVGTGSGYQAAVLAQLVRDVFSVEILPSLAEVARKTLDRLGIKNVHINVVDGAEGWPEMAPFDAIVVACAAPAIPPALIAQLREGGRIAIPLGNHFHQTLHVHQKTPNGLVTLSTLPVRFVPMTGSISKVAP